MKEYATVKPKPRPRGIQSPTPNLERSSRGGMMAQIQSAGLSMASDARVLANTPSLKKLYSFLAKKS